MRTFSLNHMVSNRVKLDVKCPSINNCKPFLTALSTDAFFAVHAIQVGSWEIGAVSSPQKYWGHWSNTTFPQDSNSWLPPAVEFVDFEVLCGPLQIPFDCEIPGVLPSMRIPTSYEWSDSLKQLESHVPSTEYDTISSNDSTYQEEQQID